MKKIVFLGATDKSHLLLTLGKLLAAAGQNVLLVDSTTMQTTQSYLPQTEERRGAFVTEFEGIDVAGGFITHTQLDQYVRKTEGQWPAYDVFLLDTDHTEFVKGRELPDFAHRVWCSNLEKAAMVKNAALMRRLCLAESAVQPLPFFKLVSPSLQTTVSEAYIESQLEGGPLQWLEPVFRFPLDERDLSVQLDNQHHSRIDVRRCSGAYRRTMLAMMRQLSGCGEKTANLAWKRVRRDRRGT